MVTPSQIKTTIRPNTFTAEDAGLYSNAGLDQFWNRILFSKHSNSTLQRLGKLLVIPLFLLIHLVMMRNLLMKILTKHYALVNMTDLSI